MGRWTEDEHQKFLEGLKLYGKNWKLVGLRVGTRNATQARSHAQKYFAKLERMKTTSEVQTQQTTPIGSPIFKSDAKSSCKATTQKKENIKKQIASFSCKRKLHSSVKIEIEPPKKSEKISSIENTEKMPKIEDFVEPKTNECMPSMEEELPQMGLVPYEFEVSDFHLLISHEGSSNEEDYNDYQEYPEIPLIMKYPTLASLFE